MKNSPRSTRNPKVKSLASNPLPPPLPLPPPRLPDKPSQADPTYSPTYNPTIPTKTQPKFFSLSSPSQGSPIEHADDERTDGLEHAFLGGVRLEHAVELESRLRRLLPPAASPHTSRRVLALLRPTYESNTPIPTKTKTVQTDVHQPCSTPDCCGR